jgi:pimeloyl-ACP methyl ester carboxylesterase
MRVRFLLELIGILAGVFTLALISASCGSTAPNTATNSLANNLEKVVEVASHSKTVSINSPDGVVLVGTFFESEKPNTPALLLLHQWQSDRHSWDSFAKEMQNDGFNVLAVDGRGFGESTKRADGTVVSAERTDDAVKGMLGDVGAAFDFLSKQKNVDPNRIGIVGASYGSSLALIYAADNPKVAAVVLLSPGTNYFGNLQTEPAMAKYGSRPAFLAAAEDDPDSAKAVMILGEVAAEPRRALVVSVPKGGHGTALLDVDGVRKPLKTFCDERLGLQPPK